MFGVFAIGQAVASFLITPIFTLSGLSGVAVTSLAVLVVGVVPFQFVNRCDIGPPSQSIVPQIAVYAATSVVDDVTIELQ